MTSNRCLYGMHARRWVVAVVLAAAFPCMVALGDISCANSGPAKLASGCTLNSDCDKPLVCAFQVCHQQCNSTRDCPATERCIKSTSENTNPPLDVCQLPSEAMCTYNSQCPSQETCAVDGQCRDQCVRDRDCVENQLCVGGACAEPREVSDAGTLKAAETDAAGLQCLRNSDCGDAGLICLNGVCQVQCLADIDCVPPQGPGGVCVEGRCVTRAGCRFNSDCEAGLVCRSGACGIECVTDVDCRIPEGPGGVCWVGVCSASPVDLDAGAKVDSGTGARSP